MRTILQFFAQILMACTVVLAMLITSAAVADEPLGELEMEGEETSSLDMEREIRRQEKVIGRLVDELRDGPSREPDLLIAQQKSDFKVRLISRSQ